MPRQSRVKDEHGIYYIRQQGSGESPLFRDEKDRRGFLKILEDKKQRFGFKVYAYCIKQRGVYHLMIAANGTDISQVMKSMNISYALYRKAGEPLFKDRYYSELLLNHDGVRRTIEKIHFEGKLEKTGFNSYCFYHEENLNQSSVVDSKDLTALLSGQQIGKKEPVCRGCIETFDTAKQVLSEEIQRMNLNEEAFLKDKKLRNAKIIEFRKRTTLSLKELGRLFGGLSESGICKVLKNQK